MADQINELVIEIREKVSRLKHQLSVELTKNESLQEEVEQLKEELNISKNESNQLKTQNEDLKAEIVKTKEQSVGSSKEQHISDEQIDELVKEIEYCIGQLKK